MIASSAQAEVSLLSGVLHKRYQASRFFGGMPHEPWLPSPVLEPFLSQPQPLERFQSALRFVCRGSTRIGCLARGFRGSERDSGQGSWSWSCSWFIARISSSEVRRRRDSQLMSRTALLIRCSKVEAAMIHERAKKERRNVSGYVLRIVLKNVSVGAAVAATPLATLSG